MTAARLLLIVLLTVAGTPATAATQGEADLELFNVAARQRMLTQRVVRAYALAGLDNPNRDGAALLTRAVTRFETQLSALQVFAARHPRTGPALGELGRRWSQLRSLLDRPVSRDRAEAVLDATETALGAAEVLVTHMREVLPGHGSRMVDLAGRQRMLSQRMVSRYLYLAWGVEHDRAMAEFVSTWNAFEAAHAELEQFPGNTDELARDLEEARNHWQWFKSALSLHERNTYFPDIVDDAGERLLLTMEDVTDRYARLLGDGGR